MAAQNGKISKYFKKSQVACKCGCGISNISKELLDNLDHLVDIMKPMTVSITSACRCAEYNKKVGGVAQSSHLSTADKECLAVDLTSNDMFELLKASLLVFTRVGISKDFVHVDIDKKKRQFCYWLY